MKVTKSEPLIELGKEERAIFQKMLTQTSKAYDINAELARMFTQADFNPRADMGQGWSFKELPTATMSARRLREHLTNMHKALVLADDHINEMLKDLDATRKTRNAS